MIVKHDAKIKELQRLVIYPKVLLISQNEEILVERDKVFGEYVKYAGSTSL